MATARRRRAPKTPAHLSFRCQSGGEWPPSIEADAVELDIEATDPNGKPAPWLDGDWWTDAIERLADAEVTVRFLPTSGALAHPVVLQHVQMVRRVAPRWRILGDVDGRELTDEQGVAAAALSGYHELRVYDGAAESRQPRPRVSATMSVSEWFGRVRTIQNRAGVTTPVLVRLASPPPACAGAAGAGLDPRVDHAT